MNPETTKPRGRRYRRSLRQPWHLLARIARAGALLSLALLCSCQHFRCPVSPEVEAALIATRVDALNRLRNELNAEYGFRNGVPRINLGPCGSFAKSFYEQWNARFEDKVFLAFVMAMEGSFCHHVLVRLPDGSYFDGGNGVISRQALLELYSGSRIEETAELDVELLDRRSHGLNREYPECPTYSPETAARIIADYLDLLPPDGATSR